MTGPARGYSWPQATVGNTLALRHGAWSPSKIDPRAHDLVEQVAPTVTWWQDCDGPAVWAWARCEARIELLVEYLAERGDLDDGDVRPAADLLTRLESQAMGHRSRLGLDPLSRARLGRDTAAASVDLARLWATDEGADTGQVPNSVSSLSPSVPDSHQSATDADSGAHRAIPTGLDDRCEDD